MASPYQVTLLTYFLLRLKNSVRRLMTDTIKQTCDGAREGVYENPGASNLKSSARSLQLIRSSYEPSLIHHEGISLVCLVLIPADPRVHLGSDEQAAHPNASRSRASHSATPLSQQLRLNVRQLLHREFSYLFARRTARVGNFQDSRQFIEREADRQRAADQLHSLESIRRILPIATPTASRACEYALALGMPQRIGAHAGESRQFARTEKPVVAHVCHLKEL